MSPELASVDPPLLDPVPVLSSTAAVDELDEAVVSEPSPVLDEPATGGAVPSSPHAPSATAESEQGRSDERI